METHDTMMTPPVEELLSRAGSKFRLVTLASMRARNINSYYHQLGEGRGASIPPQVTSVARKPLSIAFEEIAADKIVPVAKVDEPDVVEGAELAEAEPTEAGVAEAAVAEGDPGTEG